MLVDLYNKEGEQIGKIELAPEVFEIKPNEEAMHKSVIVYLAHQRQGTHKTKGRSEVSGGGKKPWRQKGRGTARAGSIRSPLWIGGGTIFGPQPHKYNIDIPIKVKRLAKKSALSLRAMENNLKVVENFSLDEIKTKEFVAILENLDLNGDKILVLLPEYDRKIYLSSRNIPNVSVNEWDKISTYDILSHKKLLLFSGAVEKLNESLKQ